MKSKSFKTSKIMKSKLNLICLAILTVSLLQSCKKEKVEPVSPNTSIENTSENSIRYVEGMLQFSSAEDFSTEVRRLIDIRNNNGEINTKLISPHFVSQQDILDEAMTIMENDYEAYIQFSESHPEALLIEREDQSIIVDTYEVTEVAALLSANGMVKIGNEYVKCTKDAVYYLNDNKHDLLQEFSAAPERISSEFVRIEQKQNDDRVITYKQYWTYFSNTKRFKTSLKRSTVGTMQCFEAKSYGQRKNWTGIWYTKKMDFKISWSNGGHWEYKSICSNSLLRGQYVAAFTDQNFHYQYTFGRTFLSADKTPCWNISSGLVVDFGNSVIILDCVGKYNGNTQTRTIDGLED